MQPLLEVSGLHTYRGRVHVLRNVGLQVMEGEAVCLVGRNGAGKTTAIESIMGLLPSTGAIRLAGEDMTRLPTHKRARAGIGFAPEDAGVFPDLTVTENLRVGQSQANRQRSMGGEGAVIEERVFGLFPEIRQFLGRRGLNLSGGQKKMVAMARAMILAPSILLLDEPFEGLAPVVVNRFIEAVNKIKSMGVSMLIAESNLSTAIRISDRLYAIDRGEVFFEGSSAAALASEAIGRTLRG